MSSNEESLKDAKSLHKTSVSDEVVIKFDHVTKTYNLYKNDRGRFLGIFNYNRKGSFLGTRLRNLWKNWKKPEQRVPDLINTRIFPAGQKTERSLIRSLPEKLFTRK